jgi:uncharacterized protein (TIGR03437 family)
MSMLHQTVADLQMHMKAIGLLVAFTTSAVVAAAQGSEPAWQLIGQIGGPTTAIATHGKYAYVGVGQRLIVLDVSNPATPHEVGNSAPFADSVRDIAVSGSIAFVAAGGDGLRVLDVSNPASPAEIGSLHVRGYAEGVSVAGSTVCLADGPYGLRVIDASNPANPTEIGSAFTRNYAFKVAMDGRYAYVAAAGAGLLIADLANPAKPLEVATLATPGYAYGLAVSGNTVHVAGGWGGLVTVDVTTKATPRLLGQLPTEGWAIGVSVSGTQAYVAAALGGLRVVDVSDPASPSEVGSLAVAGGDAAGVAVAGAIAFVADRNWGLEAVNVSAPASPAQVGFYGPLGYADGVAVAGNYAYVAAGTYGLRIIDISTPAQPRQVGAYDTQSYARSVAVVSNYAYVGTAQGLGQEGLHVVDISDPTRPTQVGFLFDPLPTRDMAVAGGFVYIANEWGLRVIDVSNPAAPRQVSWPQIPEVGVAVSGNIAYVSSESSGMFTVDVSNPSAPVVIGQLQWPNASAQRMVVSQGHAFVADGSALTVLDVSNPRAPVWLASCPTPGFAYSVALVGDQAFVADAEGGLSVVDISNPASPVLVWSYATPGYAQQVAVDGDYAYLGDSLGGLVVLAGPEAQPMASAGKVVAAAKVVPPRERTSAKAAKSSRDLSMQAASSCVVTRTPDSGPGTLRNCLDTSSSGTTVTFDTTVFPPGHPATIALSSGLWLRHGNVTIDASNAGVILDGSSAGQVDEGLSIVSDGNSVKGLQIMHFGHIGMRIQGNDNLIGGTRSRGSSPLGEGNLISGNGQFGVAMGATNSVITNNIITGNFIGTDITGTVAIGNGMGIFGACVSNNRFGGNGPGEGNVISGNSGPGIGFNGSCGESHANVFIGNYIGVDASGTKALSNGGPGIGLDTGTNGSLVQGNLIVSSGNCILINFWGSSYNTVVGNLLNTDASGRVALAFGEAVWIGEDAASNRIGGTTPAERNVINGAVRSGGGPGNMVIGNFIGTDITGTVGLGGRVELTNSSHSLIGGTTEPERNLIGGIIVVQLADYSFIGGNYIGTNASGQEVPGISGSISIEQGTHIIVQGNLVAGTGGARVSVSGGNGNTIRQNLIYDDRGGGIVLSSGANAGISQPVITSVTSTGVSGTACPGCEVEIYSDSDGEGQFFQGSTIAGPSSEFKFVAGAPLTGPNITATATDIDGNTSAFSAAVALPPPAIAVAPATLEFAYTLGAPVPAGQSIQVTNSGGGTLNWSASSNAPWLSATPTSGTTPSTLKVSVAPAGLAAGTYKGTITISASGMASQTIAVALTLSTPVVSISAVVSAASPQSALVPGSLAVATGKFGLSEAHSAPGAPLPASLGGLSLQFANGVRAPLLYASASQVDFQVPWELAGQPQSLLTASLYGGTDARTVSLAQFAPAIFSVNGGGSGQGAIVDTSNELANAGNPAIAGTTNIVIYCTGLGPVTNRPATGAAAEANPLATTTTAPTLTIGGTAADVISTSLIPGDVGVYQIVAHVPAGAPTGDAVPVVISIGGATSNTVIMAIRAPAVK